MLFSTRAQPVLSGHQPHTQSPAVRPRLHPSPLLQPPRLQPPTQACLTGDHPACRGEQAGLAAVCPYLQKQGQQGQLLRVGLLRHEPVAAAAADVPFMKIELLGFTVSQLSTVQQNPFVQNALLAL